MGLDVPGALMAAAQVLLILVGLLAPVALFGLLIWLGVRHLKGGRTPLDGLFTGIGRASAMNSHVQAGTPHPDDLAVPVPPPPGPRKRVRHRRNRR